MAFVVADADEVRTLLDRLAARVVIELPTLDAIVGIRRRGVPLAQELERRIAPRLNRPLSQAEITLKRYDDDLEVLHERPKLLAELEGLDPTNKTVLLVDDVIYTGKTLLAATSHLVDAGARHVSAAALCARGPGEVPMAADFVGMRLDIGEGLAIDVRVPPYESERAIALARTSA